MRFFRGISFRLAMLSALLCLIGNAAACLYILQMDYRSYSNQSNATILILLDSSSRYLAMALAEGREPGEIDQMVRDLGRTAYISNVTVTDLDANLYYFEVAETAEPSPGQRLVERVLGIEWQTRYRQPLLDQNEVLGELYLEVSRERLAAPFMDRVGTVIFSCLPF